MNVDLRKSSAISDTLPEVHMHFGLMLSREDDPRRLGGMVTDSKPGRTFRSRECVQLQGVERGACFRRLICIVRQLFGVVLPFIAYAPGRFSSLQYSESRPCSLGLYPESKRSGGGLQDSTGMAEAT